MGFWQKLKKIYMGDVFGSAISEADEAFFEELEETLILSDFGMEIAVETVEKLREKVRKEKLSNQEEVRAALETAGFAVEEAAASEGWCSFLCRKEKESGHAISL